jgi:hypothetical protein
MVVRLHFIWRLDSRHWLLVGLGLGLAVACAAVLLAGLGRPAVGPEEFERALAAGPLGGHPVARDVAVHERGARAFVTMEVLRPDGGAMGSTGSPQARPELVERAYRYVGVRFDAEQPYVPVHAGSEVVDFRLNPGAAVAAGTLDAGQDTEPELAPVCVNGSVVQRWGGRARLGGWTAGDDGRVATIDAGTTADATLSIGYGDYDLFVRVEPTQGQLPMGERLAVSLNGKPLAPLARADEFDRTLWRTRAPQEDFVLGQPQVLRFAAAADGAVRVRQVRLYNPSYTILDYLAHVKGTYPDFNYAIAWWDDPKVAFPLFGGSGGILFGVILPFGVRVILRTREFMAEARAKRRATVALVTGAPKLTLAELYYLVDLINSIEAALLSVARESLPARPAPEAPHPAETFVQRRPEEPKAVFAAPPEDTEFGCRRDDVYPTELGAIAGRVLVTSKEAREMNDMFKSRRAKPAPREQVVAAADQSQVP